MLQSALPGGGFVFWVLFFVFVFGQWQLHHHFCTVGVPVDKLHAAAVGVYDLLHHMQAQNMRGVLPFRFAVQHGQHALRVAGAVILYGQVQRCFVGIRVESQRDRPRIMAHGVLQHIFQRTGQQSGISVQDGGFYCRGNAAIQCAADGQGVLTKSRRSLFAAKAALGLAEIFLIVTLEAAGAPLIGHLQHYTQPYPAAGQVAYLWGCTFAVDCMIFFSELLLTVLLANPLPALCVGILGTLLGLFSAFMPAWVGYFVPWGYFIPLNTYRIADWDQASKVVTYMIVPFQWPLLVATVVLAGILFFAAWYAMRNKEV